MSPALDPVTVDVLFSVVVPPTRSATDFEQDLFLLWPGAVTGSTGLGPADRALAAYVERRGFTVIEAGRLPYFSQALYGMDGEAPPETVAGGAAFVTFVRQGGALGLTSPATYVRIPWHPRLPNPAVLMGLRLDVPGLIKEKTASFVENLFWGKRHLITISFNDVRPRGLFPMYLEHRNRVVPLAEQPSQLMVHFADADRLRIDEVAPPSSTRRLHESLESTQVVSLFLDRSEGLTPQLLSVHFGYFTRWQAWTPILIPVVFFVLGRWTAPWLERLVWSTARGLLARVHIGRDGAGGARRQTGVVLARDTLARLVPGETTLDEVQARCGPHTEEREELGAPARRTLIYRGRRVVPRARRSFGWVATVDRWDLEEHEVQIEVDAGRVRDVQARVRRTRLADPGAA